MLKELQFPPFCPPPPPNLVTASPLLWRLSKREEHYNTSRGSQPEGRASTLSLGHSLQQEGRRITYTNEPNFPSPHPSLQILRSLFQLSASLLWAWQPEMEVKKLCQRDSISVSSWHALAEK
jgi:hypothetical protein